MIIHPYRQKDLMEVDVASHRLLGFRSAAISNPLGSSFYDREKAGRVWTVIDLYAPLYSRQCPGIRALVSDQKNFLSFIEQRDLEVLLGIGTPGEPCPWLYGTNYPGPDDADWFGLNIDDDEIEELLFANETMYRQDPLYAPNGLLNSMALAWHDGPFVPDVTFRLHGDGRDWESIYTFNKDSVRDDGTNQGSFLPNHSLSNIFERWSRIQKEKIEWDWAL